MSPSHLNADTPRQSPEEDRLGFSGHATQLAKSLADYVTSKHAAPRPGMVVAIEGDWGAGKSTYLNFLRADLQPYVSNGELAIIDFDPWWLAEKENLVLLFFRSLVAALPEKLRPKAAKAMAQLATVARHIPDWAIDLAADEEGNQGFLGRWLKGLRESGGALHNWLSRGVSPRVARDRAAKILADANLGLIVVIDDLDRLEGADALAVLRFLKSIGDLPGVVYVLAYAPGELGDALRGYGIAKPAQFLEKIVQTSVQLPTPAKWRLRKMAQDVMSPILRVPTEHLASDERFETAVAALVTKPRDLARLSNNVAIVIDRVRDDVDSIDFASLHSIRLLDVDLYAAIRSNGDLLTDSPSNDLMTDIAETLDSQEKRSERRRERLLLNGPQRLYREALLKALFPRCPLWEQELSDEQERRLDERRAVALPRYFDTYFSLEMAPGVLSRADVAAVLSVTDPKQLDGEYAALATSDGGETLEYFIDAVGKAPHANAENAVLRLFEFRPAVHFADKGRAWQIAWRIALLVADRFTRGSASFKEGVIKASSNRSNLAVSGAFAWTVARARGELGPQGRDDGILRLFRELMSDTELAQFKDHFLNAMHEEVSSGDPFSIVGAPRIIRTWMAWDTPAMLAWAKQVVGSDDGLTRFVKAYAGYSISDDVVEAYFGTWDQLSASLDRLNQNADDQLKALIGDVTERWERPVPTDV